MLLWVLVIGYLSVLFLAAIWAIVERARPAIVEQKRALLHPAPRDDEPRELTPAGETSEVPGSLGGPAGALSVSPQ